MGPSFFFSKYLLNYLIYFNETCMNIMPLEVTVPSSFLIFCAVAHTNPVCVRACAFFIFFWKHLEEIRCHEFSPEQHFCITNRLFCHVDWNLILCKGLVSVCRHALQILDGWNKFCIIWQERMAQSTGTRGLTEICLFGCWKLVREGCWKWDRYLDYHVVSCIHTCTVFR